jgi:hypothetical protein
MQLATFVFSTIPILLCSGIHKPDVSSTLNCVTSGLHKEPKCRIAVLVIDNLVMARAGHKFSLYLIQAYYTIDKTHTHTHTHTQTRTICLVQNLKIQIFVSSSDLIKVFIASLQRTSILGNICGRTVGAYRICEIVVSFF